MQRTQGFAEQGGQEVWTAGLASTTLVQVSGPYATITVHLTGTSILAVLYADNLTAPTPLANPFTANSDGYWFFYADNGRYDVMMETKDWSWTISDLTLLDPVSVGGILQTQTPWLTNIDAAGNDLNNVRAIGIGGPILVDAALNITTQGAAPAIYMTSPVAAGAVQFSLVNDAGSVLVMGLGGSANNAIPDIASFNTSALGYSFRFSNQEALRITPDGMGWGNPAPAYPLDVAGDVNVTGVYRVNGIPMASGQNQSPWLSNINAANYNLSGVGLLGVGGDAVTGWGISIYSTTSGSSAGIRLTNDLASVLQMGLMGSGTAGSPNTMNLNTSSAGITFSMVNVEKVRINNAGIGVNLINPAYPIDVAGDINVSGQYRVGGVPLMELVQDLIAEAMRRG